MITPSAIAGVYADLRQVKSRGVWQLVLDIPAEKVEGMVELFGMPRQDEPTWLAVARLKNLPGAHDGAVNGSAAADHPHPPERSAAPGGAKRERTLPEKVGMLCNDKSFQAWAFEYAVGQRWSFGKPPTDCPGATREEVVASIVRKACDVASRKQILPNTEAALRWNGLVCEFEAATYRMAEERR